jgi:hypothetical protein
VEGHVDAGQRDGSKAPLKRDVALGLLEGRGLRVGLVDDLEEHLLDLVKANRLGEL